jgi:hypothetical protein
VGGKSDQQRAERPDEVCPPERETNLVALRADDWSQQPGSKAAYPSTDVAALIWHPSVSRGCEERCRRLVCGGSGL